MICFWICYQYVMYTEVMRCGVDVQAPGDMPTAGIYVPAHSTSDHFCHLNMRWRCSLEHAWQCLVTGKLAVDLVGSISQDPCFASARVCWAKRTFPCELCLEILFYNQVLWLLAKQVGVISHYSHMYAGHEETGIPPLLDRSHVNQVKRYILQSHQAILIVHEQNQAHAVPVWCTNCHSLSVG